MHNVGDSRRSSLWGSKAEPNSGAQSRAFYAQLGSTTSVLDLKAAGGQVRGWPGTVVTVLDLANGTLSSNVVPEPGSTIRSVSLDSVNDGET